MGDSSGANRKTVAIWMRVAWEAKGFADFVVLRGWQA